ncbi:DivIVA domain-containing protein [Rubrobacter marinus]|uniref:Cell wall synthesis protein Wag31 n=1 Tax=Rubrobacter marinus TaxID=2653852 RepID=A0A6G8PXC4_9ACTN|nr:DivIVA domain-containing protein [Rubrobacter marinus]QIN78840.1 DivIVA domain-containing protein [Rubrobacter marinus]
MAIKPVDVRRKEFKNSLRGYDANQVDDFLDEVADEFERSFSENQRMKDELASLKGRLEQFEELEGAIREALVHAQQVARDLRRNANKEADLVVREAKEQAHRILADSSSRVERVQESYGVLQKAKQDFQNDFRHLLKSYLAVMENADVASAKEIEASLRERLDTESIAAARQAAETRQSEGAFDETTRQPGVSGEVGEDVGESGDDVGAEDATQRIEVPQSPSGGESESMAADYPEPEVEEPEVEPSTARSGAQTDAPASAAASAQETGPLSSLDEDGVREVDARPLAAEEVDREEPAPTGDGPAYDRFFDEERSGQQKAEESRIFRASRFLRRRG